MSNRSVSSAAQHGGHTKEHNVLARKFNRRSRRKAKECLRQTVADQESDASFDAEPAVSFYREKSQTRTAAPLRRWLCQMVGRDFGEVYSRLRLHDERSRGGGKIVERAMQFVVPEWGHDERLGQNDFVVDAAGVLRLGSDFASVRDASTRPRVEWSKSRRVAVIERDGALFWRKSNGRIAPMSTAQTEAFNLLPGHDQRALKGRRRVGSKRRQDRELPWQARRRASRIALGRDE